MSYTAEQGYSECETVVAVRILQHQQLEVPHPARCSSIPPVPCSLPANYQPPTHSGIGSLQSALMRKQLVRQRCTGGTTVTNCDA